MMQYLLNGQALNAHSVQPLIQSSDHKVYIARVGPSRFEFAESIIACFGVLKL